MATVRVLTWRGIPTSVKAQDDAGRRVSRAMPDWFGQEVDRVAMREGITGSGAYLDAFTWSEPTDEPGSAEEAADRLVARLADEWARSG